MSARNTPSTPPLPTPPTRTQAPSSIVRMLARYVNLNHIWKHIVVYVVLLFITYPLEKVFLPYVISTFIVKWKAAMTSATLFYACSAAVVAYFVMHVTGSILYYVGMTMQQQIGIDVKIAMVEEIFALYDRTNRDIPVGRWLTHIENVPFILKQVCHRLISSAIPEVIGLGVVFAYFAYVDLWLGVFSVLFALASALLFTYTIEGSMVLSKNEYSYQVAYNQRVHNTIDNLAYIQTSQSQGFELDRFHTDSASYFDKKMRVCKRNTWFLAGIDLCIFAYVAFVFFYMYFRMTAKTATAAQLTLYTSVFVILLAEMRDIGYIKVTLAETYNFLNQATVFLEDVARHTNDAHDAVHDDDTATTAAATAGRLAASGSHNHSQATAATAAISSERLSYSHHPTHTLTQKKKKKKGAAPPLPPTPTFEDVTLSFDTHQMHALVGPAGCGKTTFAKLLSGIHNHPLSGKIRLYGEDVSDAVKQRRSAIVYLPQHVKLFEGTILDNIRYTSTHIGARDVHHVLRQFNVLRILQQQDGNTGTGVSDDLAYLHQPVGLNGSQVSGGQKQIILLMRTYLETSPTHNKGLPALKSKSILILDEPTASLDPQMVDVVMHLLRQLKRTHTIIVITHDMNVARACDTRTNFKR